MAPVLISPKDQARLAAIVARLGSDHDGERANALTIATRTLQEIGWTWTDLAQRAFRPDPTPEPVVPPRHAPWMADPAPVVNPAAQLGWLASKRDFLSAWEQGFVASLRGRGGGFTPGQRAKLAEIVRAVAARLDAGFAG